MSVKHLQMETGQAREGDSVVGSCAVLLVDQVALDLTAYLENFPNQSFAIRYLAKECGLNEKTIKRLLKRENKPSYQTLFRLYSTFEDTVDYQQLLKAVPSVVRDYLKKYTPCESITQKNVEDDFFVLIEKTPLIGELYVMAGCGPLNKSAVAWRYGQYGVELIDELLRRGWLTEIDKETYVVSSCAPNMDGPVLKSLGEHFVSRFSKPDGGQIRGEHTISFYAEGLNEAGIEEWLAVDSEAFYKKLEIAKRAEFQGDTPMFTFTATDSIAAENKND